MSRHDWMGALPADYRKSMARINRASARVRDQIRELRTRARADAAEREAAGEESAAFRQLETDLSAALGDNKDNLDEIVVRLEGLEATVRELQVKMDFLVEEVPDQP